MKNLDLIPADTWLERVEVTGPLAADRYSHERLKEILKPLTYDTIIIDTPPSLCWLTESALIASHYSLVCATPEFYSVKGLQRLSQFMQQHRAAPHLEDSRRCPLLLESARQKQRCLFRSDRTNISRKTFRAQKSDEISAYLRPPFMESRFLSRRQKPRCGRLLSLSPKNS